MGEDKMMSEKWFLATYEDTKHRIAVTSKRKYCFVIDSKRVGHVTAMFQRSPSWLEKNATLRILHDFKWHEYPPKEWRFGGIW